MKPGNSILAEGVSGCADPLDGEPFSVLLLPDHDEELLVEAVSPRFVEARTATFPPAFTITSPSPKRGEVMVKVGGITLLSSRNRARLLNPRILRKNH
jgi:hypothetical protein